MDIQNHADVVTDEAPAVAPDGVGATTPPDAVGQAMETISEALAPVVVLSDVISRANRISAGVSNWMASHIQGSAVSRSTEAYNHLVASLPALRDFIMREF